MGETRGLNFAQKTVGTNVGISNTTILAAGTTIHTCPAGKNQKVHVVANIRALTSTQNIRLRVAGLLVNQWGQDDPTVCASCVVPPLVSYNAGDFYLEAGDTIRFNAQNVTVEGGSASCIVSILEETPV